METNTTDELQKLTAFLSGYRSALPSDAQDRSGERMASIENWLNGYQNARRRREKEQEAVAEDFNIARMLGIEFQETCHSRVLAWLLDPDIETGTHAQGRLGLRLFLEEFERDLDPHRKGHVKTYADRTDYWVRREVCGGSSRIDIEIGARSRFIIHIENKVLSGEGDDQSCREWRDLQKRAAQLTIPPERCHAIFLTTDGSRPKSGNFVAVGWRRVALVFEEFARQAKAPEISWFASHYARVVNSFARVGFQQEETGDGEDSLSGPRIVSAEELGGSLPCGKNHEGSAQ